AETAVGEHEVVAAIALDVGHGQRSHRARRTPARLELARAIEVMHAKRGRAERSRRLLSQHVVALVAVEVARQQAVRVAWNAIAQGAKVRGRRSTHPARVATPTFRTGRTRAVATHAAIQVTRRCS